MTNDDSLVNKSRGAAERADPKIASPIFSAVLESFRGLRKCSVLTWIDRKELTAEARDSGGEIQLVALVARGFLSCRVERNVRRVRKGFGQSDFLRGLSAFSVSYTEA